MRSFEDSVTSDPPGVVGHIFLTDRGDTRILRLELPEMDRLVIEVRPESTHAFVGNQSVVRADFSIDLARVNLGSHVGRLQKQGSRRQLLLGDEVIWTWRQAWKDSEEKAGIKGLIFVERPERWGADLSWWLLASLTVHHQETYLADNSCVAASSFLGAVTFYS